MSNPRLLLENDGEWVVAHTKAALPILIASARQHSTVTYTELHIAVAKALGEKPSGSPSLYHMVLRHIDRVLNALSDEWTEGEIPPLGVLGIRESDQLPGKVFTPFLSRYLKKLNRGMVTEQNRASMVKLITQKVYEYSKWDAVVTALGI